MKKVSSISMVLTMVLLVFLISLQQVNSQPSEWIRLTTNPYGDSRPDYSPNGEKIAFQRERSDHWHRDIWTMNANGTNQELLLEGPGGGIGWPHWSPDGTKIVYAEWKYEHRNDIKFIDVNSKEITSVLTDWGPNHCPKWSSDGSKIYFSHCDDVSKKVWNLYMINVNGTDLNRITDGDYDCHYDWSPDKSKIVLQTKDPDILLMDADGSNEVKLVSNASVPEFFPDGERILFLQNNNLFSVNIDGTNVVQLTDCPSDWMIVGRVNTVSPDGKEVAFSAAPVSEYGSIYKILLRISIGVTLNIDPEALNLQSNGEWITCYIEVPEEYDVNDINVSSILLNDTVLAEMRPTGIGDEDSDGIPDLMVKFNRAEVILYILDNVNMTELIEKRRIDVTLTVTGELFDGTPFQGSDMIRIIMSGRSWKLLETL